MLGCKPEAFKSNLAGRISFMSQALPDFLVRADVFDKGMHRIWNAGDRFRMYFGGRAGSKSGKPTISHSLL